EILNVPTETPIANRGVRPRRHTQAQAQSNSKRKRQRSPSPADESEAVPTYMAPRNDVVAASRNFQRLSAVIMNDITTHKHAGPFQKPVREKDAEGYGDIIKRPQDLKSIKAAITFGNRAIGAATLKDASTDSPSATPSGNASREGATVILEKTTDLIPPRAIVNSSQLEKEVMRMFANAVMFNPGEGGMVQDAREMADDIEAKVRDWRSAERQVEGRDEDD
ncbi:Bromodomain-containing protein, partial [Delphinella strobiligena]